LIVDCRKIALKKDRITIGWLCSKYEGNAPPMASVMLGLDAQEYRVICIYLKKTSDAVNFLEEKGYKAFYISRKEYFRVFNFLSVWKLAKILKCEKVDILHCQRHQATVYGSIAAKLAKTPVVLAHVHGLNRSKKSRRKLINSIVLRWINKIITVSQAVRLNVLSNNPVVRPEQVICLNNSIDYKRFATVSVNTGKIREDIGVSSDSFVFGTVGRLAPTKGLSHLIQAFVKVKREVKREVPNSELVIIGDGRLRGELCAQAAETKVGDSIHFPGYRTDIEKLLRAMDVFVMASLAEGMPGALLEAMAADVPCIATKAGGIAEVLNNGEFGTLVAAEDADALAEAMIKSATQPEKIRPEMAEKAKRRVLDEYSHDVIIQRLENIYETEYKTAKQDN